MILKHLYLDLDLEEYGPELATPFGFRTRYLCNFLERSIKSLRYKTEGFSKLCIQGRRSSAGTCEIVPENALVSSVLFDEEQYLALPTERQHAFFGAMVSRGLDNCAPLFDIPIERLRAALEDFRLGGYRNEWTHRQQSFRQIGLRTSLLCALDSARFRLVLRIEKSGRSVFEETVLETKPDELIFGHKFKEVVVEGDSLIVRDKFDRPLFSVPYRTLL